MLPPLSKDEWLNDVTTHLAKSGSALRSKANDRLTAIGQLIPRSIGNMPVEYDINYESPGMTIRGYKMTDLLTTCVWLAPANTNLILKVFTYIIQRGYSADGMRVLEETAAASTDKYMQRSSRIKPERLVVMPGSNLLQKDMVDYRKIDAAVEEGAYVKPHPITNALHLHMLKARYKDRILPETTRLHPLLQNAQHVYVGSNSESGLAAAMYGKTFSLIDAEKMRVSPTYTAFYQAFEKVQSPLTPRERMAALFSFPESGLFSFAHKNIPDRIAQFRAYYTQYKHGR